MKSKFNDEINLNCQKINKIFEFEGIDDNKKQIIDQLEKELNYKKDTIIKLIEQNNL